MAILIVDKTYCGKSGECVRICPSVFEFGADGYARIKDGADTQNPLVETAIASCSYGAIYWG